MELEPESSKALGQWLNRSTWHTDHPSDWDRWYDFVDHYQHEHGSMVNEVALREHIVDLAKCNGDEEIARAITRRIRVMNHILDFLARTDR